MVIINTIDLDPSSGYVIDWLNFYQSDWFRINSKARFTSHNTLINLTNDESSFEIEANGKKIKISRIKSIWYRRTPEYEKFDFDLKCDKQLKYTIEKNVLTEANSYFSFFNSFFNNRNNLGNPNIYNLNKIDQLVTASNCKLKIPETVVTNQKIELLNFYNLHSKIILKPLQNISFHKIKKQYYIPYTKLLNKNTIDKLPNNFKPCLLQKYIEKEFEIRSFYLSGRFYSMAIFSQGNKQTSIDFRVYDEGNPNRVVPYQLPLNIESKLRLFMKKYKLNTGSFDLIFSKAKEYIFLEVNPVGQFGMVSFPCNYFLEKKIAEFLILNSNENTKKNTTKSSR